MFYFQIFFVAVTAHVKGDCLPLRSGPPYATCLPDQVRLHPRDALALQCLAHGSHPIQFEWSRVGRASLPPGAETTKDGKLLIAHVKLSDSGTYKCVATNHIGSSEALAKVIIKGELVFWLKSFTIKITDLTFSSFFQSLILFSLLLYLLCLFLQPNPLWSHCV